MTVQEGALLCGRYQLQQSVGRGGMADVHLAFDTKRQVDVAVKILREDLAEDPDFVRRFRQEAEALARLDHPNIVRFYGFEQDGPVAFIVMDYIAGTTLRRQLQDQRGPLELKTVTAILRDLCGALHYAHLNGIIHRDLKPGNVLLKPDGKALLTDFGISRAVTAATGITMTTVAVGTPAYMSPEHIGGAETDARSDIYSLGVLLFEMATGRRPFTGDEPELMETGGTTGRLQEAHRRLLPPDPRSRNARLPAAAAAVILRALAKRPAERWPDAVSLREAWEAAVGVGGGAKGASVTSSGGATDRQKPQAGRRSALGWVMALVGVVLLAAIAAAALASHGAGSGGATPAGARATISASATVVPAASPSPPPPTAKPAQGGGVVQVGKTDPTPALPVATVPHGTAPDSATAVPPTAVLPAPSEPTLIPTFTPPPTQAPATVPPRPIIAATRPPAPTPQSSAGSTGGVTLLRPSPGERITGPAEFAWQPDAGYALKAGEQYELIVWGVDEDPMRDGRSPVGSKTDTAVRADLAGVEGALGLSSGRSYLWGVRLITASGTRIRMLAEGRQFVYERPADGGEPPPVPTIPQCTGPGCK